ncbi:TIR domain-containing protein [Paraburkholderia sp. Tr-20389]|uniref:4a-hydroxytetrahydrobiopterin dehydratase n=1 Tax=Paraburkholderia sp. Tr-20389 TaxID=2703903 RepID=UPI00197EC588|nr:4a-hydroxytetrahydrobiopterin dehydratase [Paraburkholderia sp. Tr-20389]MBN3752889.1 TIR domain-containing protein [Paraburkholderia sp. Tr-20389]
MGSKDFLAFISYRRVDSWAASRWLADSIGRTFGPQSVFIDSEAIRVSNNWKDRIKEALDSATVVIPVIGPRWLSTADENSKRRIDKKDDWVRNEIRHAIESKTRVAPVLLSKTPMPTQGALPDAIRKLADFQGFELRDDRWESDLQALLTQMESFGFVRLSQDAVRYPTPALKIRGLDPIELQAGLNRLPGWQCLTSDLPNAPGRQRIELHRNFVFASFLDAVEFMSKAALEIDRRDHHPRWQNLWRTVSVWLTTWDIGHTPSTLDLELAAYLDELRTQFRAVAN